MILDADGKALIFELNREGSHWQSPLRGQISRNRNYLDWFDTDGSIYTFKGPYLVSLSTPSGLKVDLHYHNEKLVRLSDEKNRIVTLNYTNHGNNLPTNIPKSSTDTRRKSNTASDKTPSHSLLEKVSFFDNRHLVLGYSGDRLFKSKAESHNKLYPEGNNRKETRYQYQKSPSTDSRLITEISANWKNKSSNNNLSREPKLARLAARFHYDSSGLLTSVQAKYRENTFNTLDEFPILLNLVKFDKESNPNPYSELHNPYYPDSGHDLQVFLPENRFELKTNRYSANWQSDAQGHPNIISITFRELMTPGEKNTLPTTTAENKDISESTITAEVVERNVNKIPLLINENTGHYYKLQGNRNNHTPNPVGNNKRQELSNKQQDERSWKMNTNRTNQLVKPDGRIMADIIHQDINRISLTNLASTGDTHASLHTDTSVNRQLRVSAPFYRLADILKIDHTANTYTADSCETGTPEFPLEPPELLNEIAENEQSSECEIEQNTPHHPEEQNYNFPGAIQLDIRPENCGSFFDNSHAISRGSNIENAIASSDEYSTALTTVRWFPAIDLVVDRTAIAQISRDLRASSYTANDLALYDRLMREAQLISERFIEPLDLNGEVVATDGNQATRITRSAIEAVRFELIIQSASATSHQQIQIQRAALEMRALYGLDFRVIEIP